MQRVLVPGTYLEVSRFALGGWTFAGGSRWGEVDDGESVSAIRAAVSGGMNFIDTAEAYGAGHSEEVIGKALEGIRDQAVIASKVHYNNGHYRHESLLQACEDSLRRLRTDFIDLYQLHWPGFHDASEQEVARSLEILKKDGKIRHYAVCNFGVQQLKTFLKVARPVSNQLPYSVVWRGIEYGIIDACAEHGMGILTYSSLHGGVLSGKYRQADEIPLALVERNIFSDERKKTLTMEILDTLFTLSQSYGMSVRELSLGWVLKRRGITAVLVGARTSEQVEENLKLDFDDISDEVWDEITALTVTLKEELGNHVDMYQNPSRIR